MPAAVLFIAVLFFGWLWGIWGLLLGAPLEWSDAGAQRTRGHREPYGRHFLPAPIARPDRLHRSRTRRGEA